MQHTTSSEEPSDPGLTISRGSILLWLYSANTETEAAERLYRMYLARKNKETRDADAIWLGHCAVASEARNSVENLRDRGGLLHFGCAVVACTIDGEYVLRGGAA